MVRFPFFGRRTLATQNGSSRQQVRHGKRRPAPASRLASEMLERRAMLAAQIVQVSTSAASGSYNAGDIIPIAVDFTEAVRVTAGNPALVVNSSVFPAVYRGQNASMTTMYFDYTVQTGDTSPVFDVILNPVGQAIIWGTVLTVSDNSPIDRLVDTGDRTIVDDKLITIDTTPPAMPTVGLPTAVPGQPAIPGASALTLNPIVFNQVPSNTLDPRHGILFGTYQLAAGAGEQLRVTINGSTYIPFDVVSQGPAGVVTQPLVADGTTRIWAVDLIRGIPISGPGFAMNPWSTTDNQYYSVVATITDAAGNVSSDPTMNEVRIDMTAPQVVNVDSPLGPGIYGVGSVIDIDVHFNEPIYVRVSPNQTGGSSPSLHLALNDAAGTQSRFAQFLNIQSSGNLIGNVARFRYVVQPGDATADLDYANPAAPNVSALLVGGGYISDHAGNAAIQTLAAPGTAGPISGGSLGFNEAITVNTVAPTVTNVTSAWGTPAGNVYTAVAGEQIPISVVLSSQVIVTSNPTLNMRVFDRNGLPVARTAAYVNNVVTNPNTPAAFSTLNFIYTVQPGDTTLGLDLDYLSTGALILGAPGSIVDLGGNNLSTMLPAPGATNSLDANTSIRVQAAPVVTNVRSLTPDGTYTEGQVIRLQVAFDQAVTVRGTPTLRLNGDIPNAMASFFGYTDATGNAQAGPSRWLEFRYLVRPLDSTTGLPLNELDYASSTDLVVGTGAIYSVVTNTIPPSTPTTTENTAILSLYAGAPGTPNWLGINNNIRIAVDATRPASPVLTLTNDAGAQPNDGVSNDGRVTVNFLEGRTDTTLPSVQWMRWQYYIRGVPSGVLPLTPGNAPWTAQFTLQPGVYEVGEVEAELIDPTGNISVRGSNQIRWTIDGQLPLGLVSATITDTGASATDGITNNGLITVTGREATGQLRIEGYYSAVRDSSTPFSPPPGDPSFFSVTLPSGQDTYMLAPGLYSGVTARQVDLAGNVGPTTPVNVKLVDTTFPGPTMGPLAANRIDYPIGALERFSSVRILVDGQVVYTNANYDPLAGSSADKHWDLSSTVLQTLQLQPGLRLVRVEQTDLAGNTQAVERQVDAGIYAYSVAFLSNPLLRLPVVSMTIKFNTDVQNFSIRSLKLLYNGVTLNLSGARVARVNGSTYVLTMPKNLTNRRGTYTVIVNGLATSIRTPDGLATMQNKSYISWRRG